MVKPPRFVGPVGRVQARLSRAWSQPRASVLCGTRGLCLSIHSWSPIVARRQEKIDQWTLSLQMWPDRLSSSGVVGKRFLLRGPDEMLDSFAAPWSPSFREFFSELLGETFLDYYSMVSRMIEAFSHVSESKSPTMPSALRTTPAPRFLRLGGTHKGTLRSSAHRQIKVRRRHLSCLIDSI